MLVDILLQLQQIDFLKIKCSLFMRLFPTYYSISLCWLLCKPCISDTDLADGCVNMEALTSESVLTVVIILDHNYCMSPLTVNMPR